MEATYKFEGKLVKATCRFVDFSGYPEAESDQELPAFYCIEPFNEFVYYGGDTNYCGSLIKETLVYNAEEPIQETEIDSYVWRYNIFDDEIFYIKGEDTFEAWRCDSGGENKEMIGTLPYGKYDSCYNLYMAEEYMVVYIEDRETKIDSTFLMWLDDGSYEKLW